MKNKNRSSRGFTIQELLAVVAILILSCAIAIPAIAAIQKNLKMTELDDTARQIYLVAQNRLTSMKASGSLTGFVDELATDYPQRRLSEINLCPQDYDLAGDDWKKLYVLTDRDAIVQELFGGDSVLLSSLPQDRHVILEMNPESGDVYGVFYAEKDFAYDEVNANGLPTRDRRERKAVMVGYYGGAFGLSAESDYPTQLNPEIEIINQEDLYAKISCTGLRKLLKTQQYLTAKITLADEEYVPDGETHIWTKELRGSKDFWLRNDTLTFYVLLDSIRGGQEAFARITDGRLNAGDNLKLTVELRYDHDDRVITGVNTVDAGNSLFGSRDADGNLTVHALRHLNNLRSTIYPAKSGGITITQTAAIDFEVNSEDVGSRNWQSNAVLPGAPLENPLAAGMQPIDNPKLLSGSTYLGNKNNLIHFKIRGAGTNNTGLFETMDRCTVQNVRLVNFDVSGAGNVGTLAGEMKGGAVRATGAYLSNVDTYGRHLPDMNARMEQYRVRATGENAGGLVGKTTGGVAFTDSFGAIRVDAASYAGGLVGRQQSGRIQNCYASGDVTAASYAGGLVGYADTADVQNCYATSVVTANDHAGDIIGYAARGSIANSVAYGMVTRADGASDMQTSAAICGNRGTSVKLTNCRYLRQTNYNSDYYIPAGAAPYGYTDLKKNITNSKANSHPYSVGLANAVFPFALLQDTDGAILDHYGDWPTELKLQTSLVYYEKYATPDAEGKYFGYYAETSLTAADENLDTGGLNSWKVDTLRDEVCVEDGYAIMSLYALTSYTYTLNDDQNPKAQTKTVRISDTAGEGLSVRIDNNATLEFHNVKDDSVYTVTHCKIFQLPFALQMTDRNSAARFYDKITVTGYVDTEPRFEKYTFFYCPDFAKNAINPDISVTNAKCPADPAEEENPIYVRSPRQINALGRAAYYWNAFNGSKQFYFLQETDIDFGRYTKTYCGRSYDLMDTSKGNAYRNRPIGRPNTQRFIDPNGNAYTPSNFRNTYDGQSCHIIDYRCVTYWSDRYQFTGLFGEVQDAHLKNIYMIASDPENESGYVKSYYRAADGKHSGVGAMVGLLYVPPQNAYEGEYSSMYNCSVSGYTVMQGIEADSTGPQSPYVVGGLVGHSFGRIENCSAVSKLVWANTDRNFSPRYKMVGGLVGSINGAGTIVNSYAGGELAVTDGGGRALVGGIAGGFDNIFGAYYNNAKGRDVRILQSYSFCTVSKAKLQGTVKAFGISSDYNIMTVKDCYYLQESILDQPLTTPAKSSVNCFGYKACTAEELAAVTLPAYDRAVASGRAAAEQSYPWSEALHGVAYPFAAVVREYDPATKTYGAYQHLGDWYAQTPLSTGYLTYYELYGNGSYFCRYADENGAMREIGLPDEANAKQITAAGYGLLRLADDTHSILLNGHAAVLGEELLSDIYIGKGSYRLYTLAEESLAQLATGTVRISYHALDGDAAMSRTRTLYLEPLLADASAAEEAEARMDEISLGEDA